ncbi:MAG: hypothetical protein JW774_12925 [Candidatus Aureabacteria bacterium]|nr:hypothetical protein [Candidatus Auribacterota bacterium]
MKEKVYHCGIDVDDKRYPVALRDSQTGETTGITCAPNIGALKKKWIYFFVMKPVIVDLIFTAK